MFVCKTVENEQAFQLYEFAVMRMYAHECGLA
jgi:hypothetical protein